MPPVSICAFLLCPEVDLWHLTDVCFANSLEVLSAVTPILGGGVPPSDLTVDNCVVTCHLNQHNWAGVGNNQCRACLACLFYELSFLC